MITTERAQELMYLIRTKTPIRMTDATSEDRLTAKIPYTDVTVDTSDIYSLRDLFEAGVLRFGDLTYTLETCTLELTFYDDVTIMNDHGDSLEVFQDETINVAIDDDVLSDIIQYLE